METLMWDRSEVIGVLGGMGPLASAEFVRNIYRFSECRREQDMPRVLLDSDAGFPDRTSAIKAGRVSEIATIMSQRLHGLLTIGATRLVIACFTAHHFLPAVDPVACARLVSLVDVAIHELAGLDGRFLMLCTEGTAEARVFQGAADWPLVADRVAFPAVEDQAAVHRLIYHMKTNGPTATVVRSVDELRVRYGCAGVVGGCTEFHLISGELVARYGPRRVVDALRTLATHPDRLTPAEAPAA
jgi:aspartate racemase